MFIYRLCQTVPFRGGFFVWGDLARKGGWIAGGVFECRIGFHKTTSDLQIRLYVLEMRVHVLEIAFYVLENASLVQERPLTLKKALEVLKTLLGRASRFHFSWCLVAPARNPLKNQPYPMRQRAPHRARLIPEEFLIEPVPLF
ncbi:hypothetical protein CQS04_13170 [Chryseomicrobium excrementi]|uniref:Uncharacterized protein n=1 Tax=Chryseomicrobium excrementi TaxID=2041346 RepID=A0A2M9EWQ4_9BACL|nr:hypothetical protein CQS04_13170 [Chryseomicrobium excrementi]